jgi:two-component sensor histidine kinase
MKRSSIILRVIILIIVIGSVIFYEYSDYVHRKEVTIDTFLEMENQIVKSTAQNLKLTYEHCLMHSNAGVEKCKHSTFKKIIDPIQFLESGDMWAFENGYSIFDESEDFPEEYKNKRIDEVFKMQEKRGASHYEDLVKDILNNTEGTGWFIWTTEKGREFAAWTPVEITDFIWVVGISTPVSEIYEHYNIDEYSTKKIMETSAIIIFILFIFSLAMRVRIKEIKQHKKLKTVNEQLSEYLTEKDVLLKEIHHRVKNNMQIISSLISFQTKYIGEKEAYELLKESNERIRTMALIHEKIYQSEDFSKIDFVKYIRELVESIYKSYNISKKKIKTIIKADKELYLDIDKAMYCGLIINELINNSLKYAYKDNNNEGEIIIEFNKTKKEDNEKNIYNMVIEDYGKGLPEDIDIHKTSTLGLQLVTSLVQQLRGTIYINRENGTRFDIIF